VKRGEVWWVEFDPAVGSEIRKTRPALIVGKAMADQIMAADKARFQSQHGTVSKADMLAVEDAIRVHLGMAK
jgi:mRNA interferase MazF